MTRKANGTKVRGRANGCGTLEKRGGIYRARWVVDGKTFTKSTGTGDRREAEKVLAELTAPTKTANEKERLENLAARLSGIDAEIKRYEDQKPALPLADGFDAYRRYVASPDARRKTRAGTLDDYESQYGRLLRWLAEKHPQATEFRHVSEDMARAFLTDLQAKVSANSYNKHLTLFKRLWKVLGKTARTDGTNPWAAFGNHELDKAIRRELTADELSAIGQYVEGEAARLFAVGVYCGLRLGDACTLEWDAVDFRRGFITVYPSKTTKRDSYGNPITPPVVIPLLAPLRAVLSTVPEGKRTGAICPTFDHDYRRDSAYASRKVQRVFAEAGIETRGGQSKSGKARVAVGYHSLRHTFVSLAAEAGIPLATVQAIVGHTSPAMTRHYLHLSEQAKQREMQAFPAVFAPVAVASLPAPAADVVEAEAVVVPAGGGVELDADTLAAVDTIRREGETRADAIRRAVAMLTKPTARDTRKRP